MGSGRAREQHYGICAGRQITRSRSLFFMEFSVPKFFVKSKSCVERFGLCCLHISIFLQKPYFLHLI